MTASVPIAKVAKLNPPTPRELFAHPEREVSFVPMAQLGEDGRIHNGEARPVVELAQGYTYFANGDVIVAKITPCLQNGKAAFVEGLKGGHGFGSTEFHVIRPGQTLDGRYLFYMIWNPIFRHFGEQRFTGSAGQKRMPASAVAEFEIPLPYPNDPKRSLAEQKRIAAILDKADAIRRRRHESARLTDQLIPSLFYDMFGDPVTNPKAWPIERLDKVAQLDRGRSRHRPRDWPPLYGGPYPLIQTGDIANCDGLIRTYSQTYSEEGLAQSKLWPKGTLCITIAANIGKTGILAFDACFPDSVVGLVAGDRVTIEYVREWFVGIQKSLDQSAPQVAQKNINLAILNALQIPMPPKNLQERFTRIVGEVREAQSHALAVRENTDGLFDSLVQRAFRGEL